MSKKIMNKIMSFYQEIDKILKNTPKYRLEELDLNYEAEEYPEIKKTYILKSKIRECMFSCHLDGNNDFMVMKKYANEEQYAFFRATDDLAHDYQRKRYRFEEKHYDTEVFIEKRKKDIREYIQEEKESKNKLKQEKVPTTLHEIYAKAVKEEKEFQKKLEKEIKEYENHRKK